MLSRPSLPEILAYRHAVDEALLAAIGDLPPDVLALVELGCHHEQQHQELLLTDILHAFAQNPLEWAIWPHTQAPGTAPAPIGWIQWPGLRV